MPVLMREKEFRSQCLIFLGWTLVDIERKLVKVICIANLAGEPGAPEAPFVALLIKGIQPAMGEPTGAGALAATLDVE